MESMGVNEWLVNFDDNSTLTLKSSQIQVTEQKKANQILEPLQEDECHLNTSSLYFSPSKNNAHEEATTMLDSNNSKEYSYKGSCPIKPTRKCTIVLSTPSANTNIESTKSTTATTHATTSTSATAKNIASPSTATDLNYQFEEDDDSSYVEDEIVDYDDELLVNNLKQAEDLLTCNSDDDSDEIAGGEVVNEEEHNAINEYEYQSYVSSRKIAALKGMTTDVVKGSGRNKKTITWTIVPYHEAPNQIQVRSNAALGIRSQSILDDLNELDLPLADLFLLLGFRNMK